jgi:Ion channel
VGLVRFARHQPSAVLLAVQLTSVLVFPFTEDTAAGRALFSAVGIIVLALAVWSSVDSPAWTVVSIVLAVPVTVILMIEAFTDVPGLRPWSELTLALLYFYTAGALLAYLLADDVITRDELYAVGATFTVVAWAFAHLYSWCQAVYPDSFVAAVNSDDPRSWMELLFLSFTTLSSTGLGDVVPVRAFARALVMIEQVAGVGYIAMVVSRLVTLLAQRKTRPEARHGD